MLNLGQSHKVKGLSLSNTKKNLRSRMTRFLLRQNKSVQLLKIIVALTKLAVSSSSSDVNSDILINEIKKTSRNDKHQ